MHTTIDVFQTTSPWAFHCLSIILFGRHLLIRYYCDGIVDCPLKDDENNKDCGTLPGKTTTTSTLSLTSSTESSSTKGTASTAETSTLGTSTPLTKKITESSSTGQTFVTSRTIFTENITSATDTLINATSTTLPETSTTEKSTLLTTVKTTSNKETSTYTPKQSSTTTASTVTKTNEPTVTTSQPTTTHNKSLSMTTGTRRSEISTTGSVSPTTVTVTATSSSTQVSKSTGTRTTTSSLSTTTTSTTSSTPSASSTGIRTKSITKTSTTPTSLTSTTPTTASSCKVSPKVYLCSDNRTCINSTQICDMHPDCDSKEDEKNCPKFCLPCPHDFKCHRTCQCMSEVFLCDGDKDCEDGSDEISCPPITTTPQTSTISQSTGTSQTTTKVQISTTQLPTNTCPNNKVLKKCVKDCEHKCPYLLTNCIESQRECKLDCGCADGLVSNGTFCLLLSSCSCYDSVINDYRHPGERWERNCEVCTCFNGQTRCTPKECVKPFCNPPLELVKEPGECCEKCKPKETGPTTTTVTTQKTCLNDEFKCSNGTCIPKEWSCDHERDCFDASDERLCKTKKPECFKPLGTAFYHCRRSDLKMVLSFGTKNSMNHMEKPSFVKNVDTTMVTL